MAPIPYGRQSVGPADVAAVTEVMEGDWLTQGPAVEAFEQAVAEYCEVPHAVAFSSGTAALHGAAFAAGLTSGDELVTSAITFAASANCGAYLGATPRFADIDPATFNVSPETVVGAMGERTKAIVPVDFAGLPAPVREIREAVGASVTIIADAAHSLGAVADSRPVGACDHADMTAFSFHPVKPVTSCEGGMVTTRSPELADRLRRFRNHGFVREPERMRRQTEGAWFMEQHDLGLNYRLSDVHSALGRAQMDRLDEFISARNAVAERYRAALANADRILLPPAPPEGSTHGYHLFVIRHRGGAGARRALYDALREEGVLAQVHYLPVYWHPWYQDTYGYRDGLCPAAEEYYAGCLSLPCYPGLSEADQQTVVEAVTRLS